MKSRVCITCQESSQPVECLYQDMQTQEKSETLLFRVLYTKLIRVISLCFAKKMLSKIRVFSIKMSAQAKKKLTQHGFNDFSKFQPTRKWVNTVNLWSFSTQNLFQIRAYVISAQKAKHLDVTTMFTYSHANMPLGQSECAYYLSYFIRALIGKQHIPSKN